jgi:hypothetical protein
MKAQVFKAEPVISSGLESLDEIVQGLRLGDNVVWQVDQLQDYVNLVHPFIEQALRDNRTCVYLRFAAHQPVLAPHPKIRVIAVDPSSGFDVFSGEVHRIIEEQGPEVFYVFDNLSALVADWATDELLANFFQVTCPFLFELDTVTYFALTRGQHAPAVVARIRDTTQLLLDVFHAQERLYLHPIKVWGRYSTQMFLPHVQEAGRFLPVFQSGDAAAVLATARQQPLKLTTGSIAPWESVYRGLVQYREAGSEGQPLPPDVAALKAEMTHMLVGHHPQFFDLANRYFTVQDLLGIRDRMIGSGRIGGKAAGMLVARRVLQEEQAGTPDRAQVLEAHDSFYIGSDVFFTFLVNNDLFRLRLQLSRSERISAEEFADVEQRFLRGHFPAEIVALFRNLLDYYGQAPIIVRSSSLLEDSYGCAFAGKYRSEFCANQGTPEARLEAFMRAVKLVYASALNPDALSYRTSRGLTDNDEQMAILVMRVAGMPHSHYFFPCLAGVAFSRNLYVWNERIDPQQGVIRLVFGLGTRAVNRVGGDYPRMIAISHPELRPEVGQEVVKYSQREMDLLDLRANELVSVPVSEVLPTYGAMPLALLVSVLQDGQLMDPFSNQINFAGQAVVLTFNQLIRRTRFVKTMGWMMGALERAYGQPVDTEFTARVDAHGQLRINLLQCRPLWVPGRTGAAKLPEHIPAERLLFRASRFISGGEVHDIRHIIYIDPARYAALHDLELKKSLGRIVGRLNLHPTIRAASLMMIGPGRWGSSNLDLGVNVGYADIDHAAVLVELAHESDGQVPEVSYGTHFFQDLVEQQIIYLPVYPDEQKTAYHGRFFAAAPNVLTALLPELAPYAELVKVIDVPAVCGVLAHVAAVPESHQALCYLE